MADFAPHAALVTGSESGIGRAVAVSLADLDCDVGITWHQGQADGERTAAEVRAHGRRAFLKDLDLTALPAAAAMVDDLADLLGGVDVLVNCAGTGTSTPVVEIGWEDWRTFSPPELTVRRCCRSGWRSRLPRAGSLTSRFKK